MEGEPVESQNAPLGTHDAVTDRGDESNDIRLMTCPQCGLGEHVDIAEAPGGQRTDWVATCSGCAVNWSFSDA